MPTVGVQASTEQLLKDVLESGMKRGCDFWAILQAQRAGSRSSSGSANGDAGGEKQSPPSSRAATFGISSLAACWEPEEGTPTDWIWTLALPPGSCMLFRLPFNLPVPRLPQLKNQDGAVSTYLTCLLWGWNESLFTECVLSAWRKARAL